MTKKYHSKHTQTVHEFAAELLKSGGITKERMKKFDDMCLVQEDKTPAKNVHKINGRAKVRAKSGMLQKAS